jgi:hypothetical protein
MNPPDGIYLGTTHSITQTTLILIECDFNDFDYFVIDMQLWVPQPLLGIQSNRVCWEYRYHIYQQIRQLTF